MLVAVYGTLRKGGGNDRLLSTSTYKGSVRTEPLYEMDNIGCPFVSRGGSDSILVEVYEVTQTVMNYLDMLEGYPNLYDRIQIPTPWGDSWMYVIEDYFFTGATYVPSGDWMER